MALRFGTLTSNNEMESPTGPGSAYWFTPELQQQGLQELIAALQSGSPNAVTGGYIPGEFTPKTGNIPGYEQWLASQGSGYQPTGDNSPEYEYLQQFYNVPSHGDDDWLKNLPLLAAGAVGLGAATGGIESLLAGGGSAAAPTAALPGAAASAGPAGYALEDVMMTGVDPGSVAAANMGMTPPPTFTGGIGGAGGVMAGTAAGTPISRLFGLGQTGSDILSVAGAVAPGVLGYFGADKVSDAYRDSQNQYLGLGAPSRGRLEASYQPGFSLLDQPGYGDALNRVADISARGYSAKFGNPAGSPAAQAGILSDVWNQGYIPALANYRGQLMQAGGMGLNTSGQASLLGANAAGGPLDAIGIGLGRVMNPQPSLEDLLRQANRLTIGGRTYG